jgi:hypothetical protein
MTNRAERVSAETHVAIQGHHASAARPADKRGRETSPVRLAESVRTKPVRRSVDLSPSTHAELTEWCAKAAAEIGAKRVTGQDVMRALVDRLLVDEALSRRIRADIGINI